MVAVTHHILSCILPRRNKNVVPGQRQQQSQRNHIKFKVPNNNGENLLREKKTKLTVKTCKRENRLDCVHMPFRCLVLSLVQR